MLLSCVTRLLPGFNLQVKFSFYYLHSKHTGDRLTMSYSVPFPVWIRCNNWISFRRNVIRDVAESDRNPVLNSWYRDEDNGSVFSYEFIKLIINVKQNDLN